MNSFAALRGVPQWVVCGAAILSGQTLVLFALSPDLIRLGALLVAALVAWLLLRGSRIAWGVALVGAIWQVGNAIISDAHYWEVAIGGIATACLLMPSSIRFVWTDRAPHGGALERPGVFVKGNGKVAAILYAALAQFAGRDRPDTRPEAGRNARSYGMLVWRLGVACVLLLVAVGVTYNWQHGSGEGSGIANLVASLTWTCYAVVQVAFIVVGLIAGYQYLSRAGRSSNSL